MNVQAMCDPNLFFWSARWAGIPSQEEVSALVPRTGQMFHCSAAILWKFSRTHFLFAGQNLFAGQILVFDNLAPKNRGA